MESLDKEKIKIKDAVKNYPRLIEEELHNIGNNVVSFCRSEKLWKHIEQKLKGGSVTEKIHSDVVPASSTVVYTQSLEKILNKYGSLDYFWEFVLRELKTAQAILILHEDEDIPHIHLLLKFKKIVTKLEDTAIPELSVFKVILLLNLLNRVTQMDGGDQEKSLVNPSRRNILHVLSGAWSNEAINKALAAIDEKQIVLKGPDDVYEVSSSAMPLEKIQAAKDGIFKR